MTEHLQPLALQHQRALCLLLMAGDGGLAQTRELLNCCVENGVDAVELCAPFPNAFTDGDTVRQAHSRALDQGVVWQDLLPLIAEFSSRIRIVALLDYSHVFARQDIVRVLQQLRDAGAAAILPHGLPPRSRIPFYSAAAGASLPVVGTLYPQSSDVVRGEVLQQSGGFIYLVSHFGRSGAAAPDPQQIRHEIARLKAETRLPIALGFGLKSAADVTAAFELGADMAIVGSQACAVVADAAAKGQSAAGALKTYISLLHQGEKHA
jgi:tryptophan synthase alpha chain